MKISPTCRTLHIEFDRRTSATPRPDVVDVVAELVLLKFAADLAQEILGYGADGTLLSPVRSSTFSEVA